MTREFAFHTARPHYARDRVIDITHIKLALTLDAEARGLVGTATLSGVALAPTLTTVVLDAVALQIRAVRVDGKRATFGVDGKLLTIDVPAGVARGDALVIDIDYACHPTRGLYFIAPDAGYPDKPNQIWSQGQDEDSRYWFPCFDAPHQKSTSELIVTIAAPLTALSNGELVSRTPVEGGQVTWHFRHDVPHSCYLITLAVGDFAVSRDRWGEVECTYLVEPRYAEHAGRTLANTPKMLACFSELFGVTYPYKSYAQVFVADFIFGGMENTTATTLTDSVLMDERAALDYDADDLVSHELAHQWFGDLITCRDWGEGWLNEGFATYSEYLWRAHHQGRDEGDLLLQAWDESYFGEDSARYRRSIVTKLYDEPIDVFDAHLYEKGGRVLHMLRHELGDAEFFRSIKHYLEKHRGGAVETRDLARAIEAATGRVLDWFFAQWVTEGAGHPELEVAITWDNDKKLLRVATTQAQKVEGKTPLFRLPMVARARVAGKDIDLAVEVCEKQHVFFFPLAAAPTHVVWNPGLVALGEFRLDVPEPMLIAQLAEATLAVDRAAAAIQLGKKHGAQVEAALIQAMKRDAFWAVRDEAATALAAIRTASAATAILTALPSERHAKARRGLVRALAAFRGTSSADAIATVLGALIAKGDASYFVEAQACLSLGKLRVPQAYDLLMLATTRDSFQDVIRQHAYRGLAETRDERAIDVLLAATRWGQPSQGRRAAIGAAASFVRGRRDRFGNEVRERAQELLRDGDFRVQSSAIEALATLGHPGAIGALHATIERDSDGRLKRRAREVVRQLGEDAATSEDLQRLRTEVEVLHGKFATLREEVSKLGAKGRPPHKPATKPKARKSVSTTRKRTTKPIKPATRR
ncbi:MAG: M1 family metallopeptidase [Myxococcales bacterium]|nr:M1 family metallopeptidase [Myxococcales bacterium]